MKMTYWVIVGIFLGYAAPNEFGLGKKYLTLEECHKAAPNVLENFIKHEPKTQNGNIEWYCQAIHEAPFHPKHRIDLEKE